MVDNPSAATKSFDLPASSMLGNGSPKSVYLFFLLGLCKSFFEMMISPSHGDLDVDAGVATLVAYCPNEEMQKKLWQNYVDEKRSSDGSTVYASVRTVGKLIVYLSETLEFTEESIGGLM